MFLHIFMKNLLQISIHNSIYISTNNSIYRFLDIVSIHIEILLFSMKFISITFSKDFRNDPSTEDKRSVYGLQTFLCFYNLFCRLDLN